MSLPITTNALIIGAGPVGLFSVFTCGMMGIRCCVLEALDFIGGQCKALYPEKMIYDIPAFPALPAQDLIAHLEKQIQPFAPTFYLGEQAETLSPQEDGHWCVTTSAGRRFVTRTIVIAAGEGAFAPRRLPLPQAETFEGKSLFYHVAQKAAFVGKRVVIAGGGDSAVDWAIILAEVAQRLDLVHRRGQFRAHESSLEALTQLIEAGKIHLHAPFHLEGLRGEEGVLSHVIIRNFSDDALHEIEADFLLPFFGMASELGPLNQWGLTIEKNKILTTPGTAQTNLPGVYAIGDICTYPHKLKLILTGFAEAAQAAHHMKLYLWPHKAHRFQHSTTQGIPTELQ